MELPSDLLARLGSASFRDSLTQAVLGLLFPLMLLLRMTWWNEGKIDFGLRKLSVKDFVPWTAVILSVMLLVHFVLPSVWPGQRHLLYGSYLYRSEVEAWKRTPFAIWLLVPAVLGSVEVPLKLAAYFDGLLRRILPHADLVPWVVMLSGGLVTLPAGDMRLTVSAMALVAILAWGRALSKSAGPSVVANVLYQMILLVAPLAAHS